MLKLSYIDLKTGMILAKPILHKVSPRILVTSGTVINDYILKRLQDLKINEIYINAPEPDTNEIMQAKKEIPEIEIIADSPAKKAYLNVYIALKNTLNNVKAGKNLELNQLEYNVTEIINAMNFDQSLIMQFTQIKSINNYNITHSINVMIFSLIIGKALELPQQDQLVLGLGALLHDIGRVFISSEILDKPDRLTPEEFEVVRRHPYLGYKAALQISGIDKVTLRIILEHHEKLDGSGYPLARKSEEIHIYSQIAAICDIYEALTSKHIYRKAYLPHEAIEYLFALCSTNKLDMKLTKLFLKNITIYPKGAIVQLSNGRIAKVIDVRSDIPFRPLVELIGDDEGQLIDLTKRPAILISKIVSV